MLAHALLVELRQLNFEATPEFKLQILQHIRGSDFLRTAHKNFLDGKLDLEVLAPKKRTYFLRRAFIITSDLTSREAIYLKDEHFKARARLIKYILELVNRRVIV